MISSLLKSKMTTKDIEFMFDVCKYFIKIV